MEGRNRKEQVQNEERGTNPENLFFEFTPGIKIRNNCLWRYIYVKELQGKKIGGPVTVHPGAASVQLFTSVTNGKLAHPVGGGGMSGKD